MTAAWVNDGASKRQELRQILAEGFMAETGQTWLYDKGQWAIDTIFADPALLLAAAVEARVLRPLPLVTPDGIGTGLFAYRLASDPELPVTFPKLPPPPSREPDWEKRSTTWRDWEHSIYPWRRRAFLVGQRANTDRTPADKSGESVPSAYRSRNAGGLPASGMVWCSRESLADMAQERLSEVEHLRAVADDLQGDCARAWEVASEMAERFAYHGYPGFDAVRSDWVEVATVARWRQWLNEHRPEAPATSSTASRHD